jgi:hypothetical protein
MAHHNGGAQHCTGALGELAPPQGYSTSTHVGFCHAVHLCACVCAGTPTPAPMTPSPTLTPARSPTLAPTTVVPAVAPSGMSFFEYPRVPPAYHEGAPFTTSSTALHTAFELPLEYPRVPPGLLTPSSLSERTCLVPPVALSGPSRRSHTPRAVLAGYSPPRWGTLAAARVVASTAGRRKPARAAEWTRRKQNSHANGNGLSGKGCKWESSPHALPSG